MRQNEVEPADARAVEDTEPASLLMTRDQEDAIRSRWMTIQSGFVDEPARAVKEADELVADLVNRLTETFTRERTRLEQQWARQEQVSTEDLRMVLQRYRSFFARLLDVRAG
jgi:hypothetical protein